VLCSLVQEERGEAADQEPDWTGPHWGFPTGQGCYPKGSDFATGGDKEAERNVEISFFPKGCEPKLKLPKDGKSVTKKENQREDEGKFGRTKLPSQCTYTIVLKSGMSPSARTI
jgi:hypothetical protein